MPDIKSIAPSLFKVGSLLAISFKGPWKGEVTVQEDHLPLIDLAKNPFMKNGELMLLPEDNLKVFDQIKGRTDRKIKSMTGKFIVELPQIRLVNNLDITAVDAYLLEERANYYQAAQDYVTNQFPQDVEKRKAELTERFPRFAPMLSSYYINSSAALDRCQMHHLFFKVEDAVGLEAIMSEQRSGLASTMTSFVADLARNFREAAVEACLAFKKGMDRAGAQVDSRAVGKFKAWLERFEHQDFLGDVSMRQLLDNIKTQVFDVQNWAVDGNQEAIGHIRQYLNQIIEAGGDEGAALGVAERFCQAGAEDISLENLDVSQSERTGS